MNSTLSTLQDAFFKNEKNQISELRALERRIDTCTAAIESNSLLAQQHRSEMSSALLKSEERAANGTNKFRDEICSQLHELNGKIGEDRVTVERRLTLMERMVADLVEKVELSKNIMDSYISTSPEIIKLQTASQACVNKIESIVSDLSVTKSRFVDHQAATLSRLEQFNGCKDEVKGLRERLVRIEQATSSIEEVFQSISKIESELVPLRHQYKELEVQSTQSREDLRDVANSVRTVNEHLENTQKRFAATEELLNRQFESQFRREMDAIALTINQVQSQLQHLVQQAHGYEVLAESLKGSIAQCQKNFEVLSTRHADLSSDAQSISRDFVKLQFDIEKSNLSADGIARHMSFMDRRFDAAEVRLASLENSCKTPTRCSTLYYDVDDQDDGNTESHKQQRRQTAYFDPDVDVDEVEKVTMCCLMLVK